MGNFCHLLRRRHFAIFGNKLYPRREKFWPQVCENSELKVGSSWDENGEIQTKN